VLALVFRKDGRNSKRCVVSLTPEHVTSKTEYMSLSGGGARGLMYVGVLCALDSHDRFKSLIDTVKGVAGTSIGAFFALALCIEMTPKDIYYSLMRTVRH
jgi:predicted acylesterase/phospholipase RssA